MVVVVAVVVPRGSKHNGSYGKCSTIGSIRTLSHYGVIVKYLELSVETTSLKSDDTTHHDFANLNINCHSLYQT